MTLTCIHILIIYVCVSVYANTRLIFVYMDHNPIQIRMLHRYSLHILLIYYMLCVHICDMCVYYVHCADYIVSPMHSSCILHSVRHSEYSIPNPV